MSEKVFLPHVTNLEELSDKVALAEHLGTLEEDDKDAVKYIRNLCRGMLASLDALTKQDWTWYDFLKRVHTNIPPEGTRVKVFYTHPEPGHWLIPGTVRYLDDNSVVIERGDGSSSHVSLKYCQFHSLEQELVDEIIESNNEADKHYTNQDPDLK